MRQKGGIKSLRQEPVQSICGMEIGKSERLCQSLLWPWSYCPWSSSSALVTFDFTFGFIARGDSVQTVPGVWQFPLFSCLLTRKMNQHRHPVSNLVLVLVSLLILVLLVPDPWTTDVFQGRFFGNGKVHHQFFKIIMTDVGVTSSEMKNAASIGDLIPSQTTKRMASHRLLFMRRITISQQDCSQILVRLGSKLCDSLTQHGLECAVELLNHANTFGVIDHCIQFLHAQQGTHI